MSYFRKIKKNKQNWHRTIGLMVVSGLLFNNCGIVFADESPESPVTSAHITGGTLIDGSWHGNGDVKITAPTRIGDLETNADIFSSKNYCAVMRVNMTGGTIGGNIYGGWNNGNYNVYSNAVRITGGKVYGNVYGGWSDSQEAYGNLVEIGKGIETGNIYGGCSDGGCSEKNAANLNMVNFYGYAKYYVYGGYGFISANENQLLLGNGSKFQSAYGGFSKEGSADKNVVRIEDCVVVTDTSIFGGFGFISANSNVVTVDGASFSEDTSLPSIVSGCARNENATANNNKITILNVDDVERLKKMWICGGQGYRQSIRSANGNEVTVNNCYINGIYGGSSAKETSRNKLMLHNVDSASPIIAGNATEQANSNIINAYNVNLSGNYKWILGANIAGETANSNTLYLKNTTAQKVVAVQKTLMDSQTYESNSKDNAYINNLMDAEYSILNNKVIPTNYSYVGGLTAQGNKVVVTDCTIDDLRCINAPSIESGKSLSIMNNELIVGGLSEYNVSNTDDNDANIVNKYINIILVASPAGATGTIANNTLRLVGNGGCYQDITGGPILISGNVYGLTSEITGVETQNNNLEIYGKNIKLGNINSTSNKGGNIIGFDNIIFHLAKNTTANDVIVKSVLVAPEKSIDDNNKTMDLSATAVTVESESKFRIGDKVTLIDLTNGGQFSESINDSGKHAMSNGPFATVGYKIGVEKSGGNNKLVMTVTEPISIDDELDGFDGNSIELVNEVPTNMKNIVETRANASALIGEGNDFLIEQGISQAKAAVKNNAVTGNNGFAPFAAVGGGSMRYETGSYVDSKSWHGALGIARQVGNLTFGAAVDYGQSNYDSYMDNGTHGSGKSRSTGGSLFAELKQDNGVHFDAALRAGRLENDYSAVLSGFRTSYDESSTYYGVSLGGGKEFKVGAQDNLDVYGRVYYNHVCGSDTYIDDGTPIGTEAHFDAVDSTRLRVGARYTHPVDERNSLYAGLAWQYEFDGSARATIGSDGAPAPSLKGHSGMLELGCKVKADEHLSVDLNVNGWTGKQKGISGGVSLQWCF